MRLSDHFDSVEFNCRCKHCDGGGENMDSQLIYGLEELREYLGRPVIVTSGYRCPDHPESKARPGSMHEEHKAADITVRNVPVRRLYMAAAGISEFYRGGIGIYSDGFLHVDVRPTKARWGRIDGVYVNLLAAWEWMKKEEEGTA